MITIDSKIDDASILTRVRRTASYQDYNLTEAVHDQLNQLREYIVILALNIRTATAPSAL